MSINTMPIGKFRGQNFDNLDPQYLMDLFQEYDSSKSLSDSQKIIYAYVLNNYDEIENQIKLKEEDEHNESYELETDY